jgi:hypothetical protein
MKKTHALPATLLLALACPVEAQTPLPQMELHLQSKDGNPADVVGPSDLTTGDPEDERVFGLQGRRRAAWQVSNRERQRDEEDFDFATELKAGAIDQESSFISEHRLFTLTAHRVQETETGSTTFPAVIRVDNIGGPFGLLTPSIFFRISPSPRTISLPSSARSRASGS